MPVRLENARLEKPLKPFIKPTIVCMLLSVLSGCITVVPEVATDVLSVNSDPPGAQVRLSTGVKGITPCQFALPRKAKLMVVIEKESYEQVEVCLGVQDRTDSR